MCNWQTPLTACGECDGAVEELSDKESASTPCDRYPKMRKK